MRHLQGVVIGLVGTVLALAVAGRGLGYLLGLQYGALLAGMLAVVAFLRPRRTRPAGPAIPAPGSSGPVVH